MAYLREHVRALFPNSLVFPHVNRLTVSDKHREGCRALDIEDYQRRDSRHTFAVRAVRSGASFEAVASNSDTLTQPWSFAWRAVQANPRRVRVLAPDRSRAGRREGGPMSARRGTPVCTEQTKKKTPPPAGRRSCVFRERLPK